MSTALLLSAILTPLLLAACWFWPRPRTMAGFLVPLAPLPALTVALLGAQGQLELPWLLLGASWGLDATGRLFLGLTAALWLAAGIYGLGYLSRDPNRSAFQLAWLLTLAGNLGLAISQDMLSFLLFFTLMSVAAYPLIIHDRRAESLHAGKIYIVLVVIGELLLFWATVITASETGELELKAASTALAHAPHCGLVSILLLIGFGIKVGIMPFHSWLPLAHPAAPAPASAVLSGAMIKAGLLGWMRFLPAGDAPLSPAGDLLLVLGLGSTFLAVLIGLVQHNPKTVLAYSSISQMGLASMVVGAGLAQAPLAKRWQRALVAAGLALAAASLAGLPGTVGYVAKKALADGAGHFISAWGPAPAWLLTASAVATALLLCRFLVLTWPGARKSAGAAPPPAMACGWIPLLAAIIGLAALPGLIAPAAPDWHSYTPVKLWAASWPALCALLVGALALRKPLPFNIPTVPAGDLVVPAARFLSALKRSFSR